MTAAYRFRLVGKKQNLGVALLRRSGIRLYHGSFKFSLYIKELSNENCVIEKMHPNAVACCVLSGGV